MTNVRIFVSWSGEASRSVAELLKSWLPCVLQGTQVWVSSQDINKGERWLSALSSSLNDHTVGMICLTKSNVSAPWILFEAGALSKTLNSQIIPILCDITPIEIVSSPLSQFQAMAPSKEEMRNLIVTLNLRCEHPLSEAIISETFELWWPQFDKKFQNIKFEVPTLGADKKTKDASADIDGRLARIESAIAMLLKSTQSAASIRDDIVTWISGSAPINSGPTGPTGPSATHTGGTGRMKFWSGETGPEIRVVGSRPIPRHGTFTYVSDDEVSSTGTSTVVDDKKKDNQ